MRQRPTFRATAWESLEGRQLLSAAGTIPTGQSLAAFLQGFEAKSGTLPSTRPIELATTPPHVAPAPTPVVAPPRVVSPTPTPPHVTTTTSKPVAPTPTPTPTPSPAPIKPTVSQLAPQTLILPVPYGFLNGVNLTPADIKRLDAAVDTFASGYTGGQNPTADAAAVSAFQASLGAFAAGIWSETHGGAAATIPSGTPASQVVAVIEPALSNFISPLLTGQPLTSFEVSELKSDVDVFARSNAAVVGSAQDMGDVIVFEGNLNLLITSHLGQWLTYSTSTPSK